MPWPMSTIATSLSWCRSWLIQRQCSSCAAVQTSLHRSACQQVWVLTVGLSGMSWEIQTCCSCTDCLSARALSWLLHKYQTHHTHMRLSHTSCTHR